MIPEQVSKEEGDSNRLSYRAKLASAALNRSGPAAAIIDQAWLSLLNFSVAFAFIRSGTKEEYGSYLLLLAPLLLVQGIQNGVVNSPLATLLPSAGQGAERDIICAVARGLNVSLAILCAALGGGGLLAYGYFAHVELTSLLAGGFALAIAGTIARESQRAFAYARGDGVRALMGDIAYGAILLGGVGIAIVMLRVSAGTILLLMGVAGLAPLAISTVARRGEVSADLYQLQRFWSCARWAIPSVVATWISLSSYPYFAGRALGVSAVADIGAARLFLMPIGVVMTAWANWYRPRISGWISKGNIQAVKNVTKRSLVAGMVAVAILAFLVVVAYPKFEAVLGPKYEGLRSLVLVWLLFFALSLVRNIFMASLMTNPGGYRVLHHISWMALGLSVVGFLLFAPLGAIWIVAVLCAVEAVQTMLVARYSIRGWKRAGLGIKAYGA
jgi:O-antigen/teichoic acid export membrane protein